MDHDLGYQKTESTMNWKIFFNIYLVILIVVMPILFWLCNKWSKQGVLSQFRRGFVIAFALLIIFLIPILSTQSEMEEWRTQYFSGRITGSHITENHAIIEYSIIDLNNQEIKVFDRFWKLKEFKVGDWVEKQSGNESVIGKDVSKEIAP